MCLHCARTHRVAVEVLWSHTTDSMCLAYMSTNDQTPKVTAQRGDHVSVMDCHHFNVYIVSLTLIMYICYVHFEAGQLCTHVDAAGDIADACRRLSHGCRRASSVDSRSSFRANESASSSAHTTLRHRSTGGTRRRDGAT